MRGLKTWACAVVFAASAAPVFAQTGGTGGTGGISGTTTRSTSGSSLGSTTLGSSSSGSSSLGSSSLGTSSLGSSSLGSSSLGSSSSSNSTANGLSSLEQSNTQFSNIGVTSSSNLQRSNVFSSFYANPYAMGLSSSSGAGGFGQPLYGATTGGTGRTGTTTGTTGRLGTTGLTNSANQSGIVVPLPVQIAYSARVQFPTPPVATPRLQADLRGIIDAGGLATPQTVQVIADANNNITLRGTVKDDDERRLTEGLVRLTPGVQNISNELTYPGMNK